AAAKRRPQPQPVEPEEDKTPPAEDEKAKEDKPKKAKPSEDPPDEDSRPAKNAGDTGADIVEHLLKSTLWLVVPLQMADKVMLMTGSGALTDRTNKLVLTNYHVVSNADKVAVFFPQYRKGQLVMERNAYLEHLKKNEDLIIEGKVLAVDKVRDLALVQVTKLPNKNVQALPLADQKIRQGQAVHSLGNPGSSG